MARALLARFTSGERVAVYAPNCPEWPLLQHGMALAACPTTARTCWLPASIRRPRSS